MSTHDASHPLAGRRVSVLSGHFAGTTPQVIDWYDRVTGRAWTQSGTEDARTHRFAFRAAYERLPLDGNVVLCRFHRRPDELLHESELGEPAHALALIGG
ncbi:hypothetical protein [Methylorubrum zatmanii]